MKITITSISALAGGAEVSLTVRISDGERFETKTLVLLARQYAELRPAKEDIDCEKFELLLSEAEICSAVKRGMNILGYGACSEKNMALKLRSKGFSKDTAARAAEYLRQLGYINEVEDAAREAERCLKKGWGRRRIASALFEKGYSHEAAEKVLSALDEVDFSDICAQLVLKKFRGIPEDISERRKLTASLVRYGYTSGEIKNAFKRLSND